MGRDLETTRRCSAQPAGFARVAEGCSPVSYIFCFQTQLLFPAFSPFQHFGLLPVQASSYFISLLYIPFLTHLVLLAPNRSSTAASSLPILHRHGPPFLSFHIHLAQSQYSFPRCLVPGFFPANPGQAAYIHSRLEMVEVAELSAHGTANPGVVQLQPLATFRQSLSCSPDSHHCFARRLQERCLPSNKFYLLL